MAVDVFLDFAGEAPGEAVQRGHERWIEVESWSWRVDAPAGGGGHGGGARAGKAVPSALVWTHRFDTASIALLGKVCTGRHFARAVLDMVRAGPDGAAQAFLHAVMQDVRITAVATSAGSEDVQQEVSMEFRAISIDYRAADARGGLATPSTFSWDIAANVATP